MLFCSSRVSLPGSAHQNPGNTITTHFSCKMVCKIIGIPIENCRMITTSEQDAFAINGNALGRLKQAIQRDIDQGFFPFFLSLTVGPTAFVAIDDVAGSAEIVRAFNEQQAQQCNVWVHVDGAIGLSYGCLEATKATVTNGLDEVDSIVVNGHKALGLPMGHSLTYFNNPGFVLKALSLSKEHEICLVQRLKENKETVSYKDWQLGLGRPWRSLGLYIGAKLLGKRGFLHHLQRSLDLTSKFEELIEVDDRIYVFKPRYLSIVCFRIKNMDYQQHLTLLENVIEQGNVFITHAEYEGQCILRFYFGGLDVDDDERITKVFRRVQREIGRLQLKSKM